MVWNIIFIVIAIVIFVAMCIVVFKVEKQYHDKSNDIKLGMKEDQVIDIMEKDPASIEFLKDGQYEWIYEHKYYKGWGMVVVKTEVVFNANKQVIAIKNSESIENSNSSN